MNVRRSSPEELQQIAEQLKPPRQREADLATGLVVANLTWNEIKNIGNLEHQFPHIESAKKRLQTMLKDQESGADRIYPNLAETYYKVQIIPVIVATLDRLFAEWDIIEIPMQEVIFKQFLVQLMVNDEVLNSATAGLLQPELTQTIEDIFVNIIEEM